MDMVMNQVDWNKFDYTEPYYGAFLILKVHPMGDKKNS